MGEKSPYQEGMQAWKNFKSASDCPYSYVTERKAFRLWMEGWAKQGQVDLNESVNGGNR